jgi:UDPglucose--hexose-1-phosphate uridylyltransferase
MNQSPHRRLNILTGEWVLVSPHRTQRPWQGQVEKLAPETRPAYDPACYLCPGNERAGGYRNPPYEATFAFDNDFAALLPDSAAVSVNEQGLIVGEAERGLCRVVCFSPDHSLTLGGMKVPDIRRVVDTWREQYRELSTRPGIGYVQIFENRGAMMGCSNPHPHGQIWATEHIPTEVAKEDAGKLAPYLALELTKRERIVCENESFVCLVPYWAVWPFETMVVCRRAIPTIAEMTEAECDGLASILQQIVSAYDRVFDVTFPYSMGIHQRPGGHVHLHFYPPLLRSATVKKFMVGFEMLAMPQRDITPESAADRLRSLIA